MRIVIAGCGSIGSQVAWHISSGEHEMILLDDDAVAEHNVTTGTSMYCLHHVGMPKVVALAELLWRKCECRCNPLMATLEDSNLITKLQPDLVIDGFDNVTARTITHGTGFNTVHVGVSEARTGEVCWDGQYQLPDVGFERNDPRAPCTHELGRQILRFTVSVAAGVIEHWMETGEKINIVTTERMEVLRIA